MDRYHDLQQSLANEQLDLGNATKYQRTCEKEYKNLNSKVSYSTHSFQDFVSSITLSIQLSSSCATKSNIVLKMVDLPLDQTQWSMSAHPRSILDQHASLCRQMRNLSTFKYDTFRDGVADFVKSLDDYIGEVTSTCKTGTLEGLSRWPLENGRILREIERNVNARGGAAGMSLRDYVESYVSMLNFILVSCFYLHLTKFIVFFRCHSSLTLRSNNVFVKSLFWLLITRTPNSIPNSPPPLYNPPPPSLSPKTLIVLRR